MLITYTYFLSDQYPLFLFTFKVSAPRDRITSCACVVSPRLHSQTFTFRAALTVTVQSTGDRMSTMRRRTKLLTCALVGTIIFMLLHSKYFRQKTVALLEPVQLVDLLNRKELINAEPPDGTIIQTASVYGERSATEMDERIKLPVQLVGVDNLTPIIITQIKNDGSDVPHIKDRSVEAVPQIKDRSVEAVTQIKDHVEAVTQRIQSVEVLTQTRDQGIEQISVEAVTQTIDQGVEEPVTQIKDQHAEDMTQIKEGDPDRNLIPSTVTSDQSINTLHPTRTSVPMHQTTQHPLSLLSALHAPPSFPWLPEERTEQVMLLGWIKDLQSFLTTVDVCCPIAIVTSDSRYANALLNWLILSTVKLEDPIKNTLVLSLDSSLHQLLQNRSIKSLHITPSSLSTIKHDRFHAMKQVEVVRLTVMRLLNYWGFDIANYDSDAMILKNPQPIYDRFSDKDVIGSAGYFPFEIHKTWGVTLCMGVVMIRATKQTGIQYTLNLLATSLLTKSCILGWN